MNTQREQRRAIPRLADVPGLEAELDVGDLHGEPMVRPSQGARIVNLVAILLPLVGLIAGIAWLWGFGASWLYIALLGIGYALTAVGITVGYHRLFTHKSFDTNPVVKVVLAILGSMAAQGSVISWAAWHRKHHRHSDRDDDPHSPNTQGLGLVALFKGMVHAHCGWLLRASPRDLVKYVPDLHSDRLIRWMSRLFPLWVLLGLLIPGAIALAITGSWTGGFLGILWGGLARVFFVHHVTWSVNSVCHLWGTRPFASHDHSRNNPIVGILALGEGWHNNHHAFPASARHGLRWWEIDFSYLIIRSLVACGLARNMRVPCPERVAAKRRR